MNKWPLERVRGLFGRVAPVPEAEPTSSHGTLLDKVGLVRKSQVIVDRQKAVNPKLLALIAKLDAVIEKYKLDELYKKCMDSVVSRYKKLDDEYEIQGKFMNIYSDGMEKYTSLRQHLDYPTVKRFALIRAQYVAEVYDELTQILYEYLQSFGPNAILFTYALILLVATITVYIGCRSTIKKPKSALDPDRESELFHPVDLEIITEESETITEKGAALLPITGGITLVGFYIVVRKYSIEKLMEYLNYYIMFVGLFAISATFAMFQKDFLRVFFNSYPKYYQIVYASDPNFHAPGIIEQFDKEDIKEKTDTVKEKGSKGNLVLNSDVKAKDQLLSVFFSSVDLYSFLFAMFILYIYHFHTRHWLLSNILGISFALFGIKSVTINSFKAGFIMLAGLFLYDIFFVFGTDVMVTVATKVDIPAKILVPRLSGKFTDPLQPIPTAMLGLGDIVVPAIFLALCLRYDVSNYYDSQEEPQPFHLARKVPTPFFSTGLVFYIFALVLTMGFMHFYQHAQPALLYICPALILSTVLVALIKGQFLQMWRYSEEDSEEDKNVDVKEENKSEGENALLSNDSKQSVSPDGESTNKTPQSIKATKGSTKSKKKHTRKS